MSGKKGWFIQGLKDTESTTFETPPNNPEITTFGTTPHHTGGTTFHFGAEQKKIILCVFFGICAILISIFVCRELFRRLIRPRRNQHLWTLFYSSELWMARFTPQDVFNPDFLLTDFSAQISWIKILSNYFLI